MNVTFSVYRYNPDVDNVPHMKEYRLDIPEGSDMMVLDALIQLKELDPTLAFRRSCREGVCGSDGLNMNGKNGLACITPLSDLLKKGNNVVIRPLPGLPVIRDLVIDMTQFYTQWEKVKPFLINDEKLPPVREHLQSPKSAPSWMACTSVFSVPAAPPLAPPSGGTRTSSSARPVCSPPIAGWRTAAIPRLPIDWVIWMTPSACSVATAS